MHFEIEEKIKSFVTEHYNYVFILVISILAFGIRLVFAGFESRDYLDFGAWYDQMAESPGFSGFGKEISNYPPAYLYLLKIATLLPVSKLFAIKLIGIVFEYVAAI